MSFTGKENQDIPLKEASEWTANYRKINPDSIKGHLFGEDAIKKILTQKHCVGIRVYYALDDKEQKQLIVVGVDKNENDLYEGRLADRSVPCPPTCGNNNPLNS